MSFVRIWIHSVRSTKNRKPYLQNEIRQQVFDHIIKNAKQKDILIEIVGGYVDHIHILFRLTNDQTPSKVIQLIKGESSYWINKHGIMTDKFEWQREYFAVSVSEDEVSRIKQYIRNQSDHHRSKPYKEIYDDFIKKYRFEIKG